MQGDGPVPGIVFHIGRVVLRLAGFNERVEVFEEGSVDGVTLALTAITEVTRVPEVFRPLRQGVAVAGKMAGQRLGRHLLPTDTFNLAGGAGEAGFDQRGINAHGFKDLGSLIGRESADPHFGHDFQHALLKRGAVIFHGLEEVGVDQLLVAFDHLADGFISEPWADCLSAITKNGGDLVGVPHLAGVDYYAE